MTGLPELVNASPSSSLITKEFSKHFQTSKRSILQGNCSILNVSQVSAYASELSEASLKWHMLHDILQTSKHYVARR